MLMPGEMKPAGPSRTQEVQNLLLHRLIDFRGQKYEKKNE